MMDEKSHEDQQLGFWIREAGDPEVEADAAYAGQVRRTLLRQLETPRRPARWRRTGVLAAIAVAATVLVVLLPWYGGPSAGWAQVVAAVRARPWIHCTIDLTGEGKGAKGEFWYSPTTEIAALRDGQAVTFDDLKLKTRQTYDPAQETIVRTSMPDFTVEQAHSFDCVFREIFRGDAQISSPILRAEIVGQRRGKVTQDGHQWLEYELSLREELRGSPQRALDGTLVFRVDPETRLPKSMRLTRRLDGQSSTEVAFQFDYPDRGPADIYALGVPRSAKMDDRIPVGDLAQVVAENRVGRERMASYRAVVTESGGGNTDWLGTVPFRVWKKGNRWRLEWPRSTPEIVESLEKMGQTAAPRDEVGISGQWKKYVSQFDFTPVTICDGKADYQITGDDPESLEWERIGKATPVWRGRARAYAVERYAYPSLPIPSERWTGTLDLHPKEGPAGTILLTAKATGDYGPSAYPIQRYWLDPAKGYVTCRHELDGLKQRDGDAADPSGRRKEVYVMEDFQRSPQGVWYPIVVRRKNSTDRNGDGVFESDQVYRFSIDFDLPIPDSLFEPQDH